jgi:hypothetical protein
MQRQPFDEALNATETAPQAPPLVLLDEADRLNAGHDRLAQIAADPVYAALLPAAHLGVPLKNPSGVTSLAIELAPKRLELLHELVPTTTSIALLVDPANPVSAETQWRGFQQAARILGLEPHLLNASSERDFENVFATVALLRAGGLVIGNTSLFNLRAEQLCAGDQRGPGRQAAALQSKRRWAHGGHRGTSRTQR